MVTDDVGKRISRTVFDAWGLRRGDQFGAVSDPFAPELRHSYVIAGFDRGFTQHQMLDDVGLIHMNARLYDPVLGRMISADSVAPEPGHTQGLNRYAYVFNNPFGYTDPSGHAPSRLQQIVGQIIGSVITVVLTPFVGPQIAGAIGGYVGGWIGSGGDTQAAKQGARAGFIRGSFKLAAQSAGIDSGTFGSVVVHSLSSGTASRANGGNFKTGFYAGAFTSSAGGVIGGGSSFAQVMMEAVAGAIVAKATGGDALTGAVTAAFGRLFGDSQRRGEKPRAGALLAEGSDNYTEESLDAAVEKKMRPILLTGNLGKGAALSYRMAMWWFKNASGAPLTIDGRLLDIWSYGREFAAPLPLDELKVNGHVRGPGNGRIFDGLYDFDIKPNPNNELILGIRNFLTRQAIIEHGSGTPYMINYRYEDKFF